MKNIAIVLFDITKRTGTERAVCNLANLLAKSQKYTVSIISIYSSYGGAAYDINKDISLYHCRLTPFGNRITRLWMYRLLIKNIKQICKKNNIDIILGTTHGINIMLFFIRKKATTIACEHLNYMAAPKSARILRRVTYPFLKVIVTLTLSDVRHYSFHKNVKVIPNSLSFVSNKQAELINKEILAVGRLTNQKGFDLLINAISLIKDDFNGWKVNIIGSGEDEDKLKKQIEKLNLQNIIRIYPPTKNIELEYQKASIYVMSSRYEGLPMVLIEAQTCGLPIVSFDCPEGPSEVIHNNDDGFLVENGNIENLSKAILELMCNQEKRIQFGKKALENSNKYKPESIFTLWDNLFNTL